MNRSGTFLIGLLAGAVSAAVMGILATLGAIVGVPLLIIGILIPPRLFGAAGTLIGFGAGVLVLFGRIALTCIPPGCSGPAATPFLAVGAISVVTGLVLVAVGVARSR